MWGLIETECLPPFQIQVKGIMGRISCVMIFGSDLVEEVARQIAQTIGMPATEIRLQWGGHALDMQDTVRSYGIQRVSAIFASLRLRGGVRRLGEEGAAAPAPGALSKPQHKLET